MDISNFDIVIIGGGLAGLSIASFQSTLGKKVAIINQHKKYPPASLAATGVFMHRGSTQFYSNFRHLQIKAVEYYPKWLKNLNQQLYKPIVQQNTGEYHFFDFKLEEGQRYFNLEIEKLTREKSCSFEVLTQLPLKKYLQHHYMKCIWFPKESYIDVPLMLEGLKLFCIQNKVSFFEDTTINEIDSTTIQLNIECQKKFKKILCNKLIIAAGAHSHHLLQKIGYSSFLEPIKGMSALIPRFYSEKKILHYNRGLCFVPHKDKLIVGSTSEKSWDLEFSENHANELKKHISQFIHTTIEPFTYFQGLRPKIKDRLPLIGFLDTQQKIAVLTGHYKCGIGMIPYSAHCLSQMIEGETPDFDISPFDPKREIKRRKRKAH